MTKEVLIFKIPSGMKQALKEKAFTEKCSVSELVRYALHKYLILEDGSIFSSCLPKKDFDSILG